MKCECEVCLSDEKCQLTTDITRKWIYDDALEVVRKSNNSIILNSCVTKVGFSFRGFSSFSYKGY